MTKLSALEAAKKIKMLVFDCDGVMTDGSVTYDENGVEYKTFNVKDGHGIVRMNKSGFITAIITATQNGEKPLYIIGIYIINIDTNVNTSPITDFTPFFPPMIHIRRRNTETNSTI